MSVVMRPDADGRLRGPRTLVEFLTWPVYRINTPPGMTIHVTGTGAALVRQADLDERGKLKPHNGSR